jgi:branched-chain amino acid transport system ATP-binding protein
MASPAPLLSAQGLRKDFGGLHVVRDMFLTLEIGQILGVIGPNGAGKSTLFNLLSGSLPLNAGRITLDGTDLTHAPAEARLRAGLGRTFQIPRPFPRMTLLENTLTAAQNQPGEGVLTALFAPRRVRAVEAENTARAHDILSFLSLDHLANQPAAVLSGGQR